MKKRLERGYGLLHLLVVVVVVIVVIVVLTHIL